MAKTSKMLGRYEIIKAISHGGQNTVYLAIDTLLDREVIIDINETEHLTQGVIDQFMNEARQRASLGHPSIASIYDYGVTDGRLYLVMEPIQGMPVAEVLHRRGKFPPAEAIGILAQIAEVLDFVHAHSVFYGDLNPENIFISPDGMVRILDSGIAPSSLLDNLEGTTTGRLIGTSPYMAPEISLEGKKFSPASDVYSLGVIAYEILTGHWVGLVFV